MKRPIRPVLALGLTLALTLTGAGAAGATTPKSAAGAITSVQQLTTFTNCTSAGTPANKNLTIAFAQTDLATPWRVSEQQNFKFWATKLCIPHFIWNQANESVSAQLSNVSDLLARKPGVLILDPEATKPLVPAIDMANRAHTPLIVVDRALSVAPGRGEYQLFIGANQFIIGYQSAQWWIHKLKAVQHTNNPKANLAIIMGGVGQDPAIERNNGVLAAIKAYHRIKVVAIESGDWTLQGGRAVMEAYIQRFPAGSLQGVFCASDEMMLGAQEALAAAHRTDINGWFFTGDGQLQGIQAVISGANVADTQNPPFYGQPSLEAAIAISQRVTFHGSTLDLQNRTFTCQTAALCAAARSYAAQVELAHLLF